MLEVMLLNILHFKIRPWRRFKGLSIGHLRNLIGMEKVIIGLVKNGILNDG